LPYKQKIVVIGSNSFFKLDLETGGDQQRNCGKPVGKKMSQPGERFASVPPPNAKMQDLTPRFEIQTVLTQFAFAPTSPKSSSTLPKPLNVLNQTDEITRQTRSTSEENSTNQIP
jgi:hypothetical protein